MTRIYKSLVSLALFWLFYRAGIEFFNIASGTGERFGDFSLAWAVLFAAFILLSILFLGFLLVLFWRDDLLQKALRLLETLKQKTSSYKFVSSLIFIFAPILFFQYTAWGVVFQGIYIRLLICSVCLFALSVLLSKNSLLDVQGVLTSLLILASAFSVAASLSLVTDYPFSLGWSEGNRLWDYSILFGSELYHYPPGGPIPVFLDVSRQFVGGLIYLFTKPDIQTARIWVALIQVWPYLLAGLVLFAPITNGWKQTLAMMFWSYLFLKQGPIHPPLVLVAALTAFAWRKQFAVSIPLVILAGYLASYSRYTWMFAPAIWIFMLEFTSTPADGSATPASTWKRAILLGAAAAFGGVVLPSLLQVPGSEAMVFFSNAQVDVAQVNTAVTRQPLLWYRLFPNPTYGNGIILGGIIAVSPMLILLSLLAYSKQWKPNLWQRLVVIFGLLPLLAVGLVVSTKIGGGGDLHNLDMFFIALLFVTAAVFVNGGRAWLEDVSKNRAAAIWLVVILVSILLNPLRQMRGYDFGGAASWLVTLTDAPSEKALEMYPSDEVVDNALEVIREEIVLAKDKGEILFMDQRQLLTFGFIKDVPLVADYDKKLIIEKAMANDAAYFDVFYKDLAEKRFSLIISQPLNTAIKGASAQFGEENDAWTTWVSIPMLCYYDEKATLKEVGVQLFVPKEGAVDCTEAIPQP